MNPKAIHPIQTIFLMGYQAVLLLLAFWCTPAQAQIDFSVLDKYRGNQRPSDWNNGIEKPPGDPSKRDRPPSSEELKRWADRQKLVGTQKQQIKGELARLSRGYQIQRVQPSGKPLEPRGSDAFGVMADRGERPFGAIMVGSLSGIIGTPASRIPLENLRLAAAILESFKPGQIEKMSEEDMSFLASQSALAMEGAPLSVEIRDLPVGREDDVRRLVEQIQDIETVRAEAERATTERLRVEEQLVKAQKDLHSGRGDTEALKLQREIVLQSYKAAYNAEANKKAQVQDMTGKLTRVWH